MRILLLAVLALAGVRPAPPPADLPAPAAAQLEQSVAAAARVRDRHVWRDRPPVNPDGSVNAYIEIRRGDRRKWELDMAANRRVVDRVMPASLGGYPVNYGLVPQTVSYDGDPFDALVIGPAIAGGTSTTGVAVGIMHMEDEKGLDSKVVLSPRRRDGSARYALTEEDKARIGRYFARYKEHEPGKFSKVTGWGSAEEGLAYVRQTHAFFSRARQKSN
jgi:inorganic pyrophosphatase